MSERNNDARLESNPLKPSVVTDLHVSITNKNFINFPDRPIEQKHRPIFNQLHMTDVEMTLSMA